MNKYDEQYENHLATPNDIDATILAVDQTTKLI